MIWVNITLIINQWENTPKKILTSLTILLHTLFAKESSRSLWEDQEALLIRKKIDVHLTFNLNFIENVKKIYLFLFIFQDESFTKIFFF